MKRPLKVMISIITLVAFLFNTVSYDLAWAARAPLELTSVGSIGPGGSGIHKELRAETFTLPEYLGQVKYSWSPTPRRGQPSDKGLARGEYESLPSVVIHIQDAHCNYAAQHRIAEIIQYLHKEYGLGMVNLEGGARDYDLSIFTNISDKAIRDKVADSFVKDGLVSGAEYFAINNPEKVTLWGIEDVGLYLENLNIYRESLKHKEEVDRQLKALNHLLSNLKVHIYSKDLVDFDLNYTAYKGGNLGFREYLAYLVSRARDEAIDIKQYENIYLLQNSLKEEDGIDFKKATIERDSLVDMLQKKLSRNALEELVLKTLEFKTGKLSQHNFYNYILGKAKLVSIDMGSFSELQKYIAYIAIHAAVDRTKIFEEVNHLEDAIKSSLYENDSQKELSQLSKNLALLKNIFNISLSKDDYRYYQANESSFDMRNYTRFISRYAGIYNITATLDDGIERIDQYREDISSFYECSLKRDRAFLGNIKFDEQGTRVKGQGSENRGAIIVTGGFHTENLCELFKKSGISYVSIMPNFRNKDGYECLYFRLLAGELTALQKRLYSVFSSANFSSIAIAPMLSRAIAEEVWGRLGVTVLDAEAIIRTSVQEGRKVILSDAIDPETAKPLEFGSGQ
ncbi:MAG: hypothetical protein PHP46_06280, partial [Candidatus Omnitrophica bacterium]|nr:hypothetical protein [Candidatus Omnitrophota bacterium]